MLCKHRTSLPTLTTIFSSNFKWLSHNQNHRDSNFPQVGRIKVHRRMEGIEERGGGSISEWWPQACIPSTTRSCGSIQWSRGVATAHGARMRRDTIVGNCELPTINITILWGEVLLSRDWEGGFWLDSCWLLRQVQRSFFREYRGVSFC